MAVRVRVRICMKSSGRCVETSALVNSGYETSHPEILVPRRLAEHLLVPLTPPKARTMVYETPFGFHHLTLVEKEATVELVSVGAKADNVDVAISELEREVLLSDTLSSALGIQLIDIGAGLWRHRDDPPDRLRRSASPEYW